MSQDSKQSKAIFWKEHIKRSEEFGGSGASYCLENKLSKPLFYYWKRRLKADALALKITNQKKLKTVGFSRVVAAPEVVSARSWVDPVNQIKVRITEFEISASDLRSFMLGGK